MKNRILALVGGAALLGSVAIAALAQTYPPAQVTGIGVNDLIQVIPGGVASAQSKYAAAPLMANFSGTPKNYLDNGALNVQQRGTGIVTCGTTTTAVYGADRWACQANVSSGAGRSSLVTTAALLPVGFTTVNQLYRTSGALTQPICAIQEIPTKESVALAGQTVTFSVWEAALAGLAADNGNVTTLSIIYGTGTDEGIQTPSTTPLVTPAWTGIATAVSSNITITTVPTRYSVTGTIPTTATEVGVEICFTPTATGAGTTDGFAWTGAQLEVSSNPTAFDWHTVQQDTIKAQRYFYRITESTTAIFQRAMCAVSTTSLAVCQINFPQVMAKAPTMTYTSGFTLTVAAQTSAVVCTATRTSTTLTGAAASTQGVPIDCTSSTGFGAAGTAAQLYDLGTGSSTGVISASAEF